MVDDRSGSSRPMWRERLLAWDQQWSAHLAVRSGRRPLRLIALVLAHTGDSPLWFLMGTILFLQGSPTWRDMGERILIGTLVVGAITTALKWVFRRQRPPGEGWSFYTRFDRHAFPSGHAGRTACIAVLLGAYLSESWGVWSAMGLWVWVALVGIARVALQVHFLGDIVGGWLIGVFIGALIDVIGVSTPIGGAWVQ